MKTLVTGGTGFIGRHLVRALLKDRKRVRILARDEESALDLRREGAEIVYGDIRDPEACKSAVKGMDVVFHLAAVIGPVSLPAHVYFDTHVTGTQNLLQACLDDGVRRFVHCSTASVVGVPESLSVSENAPCNPSNFYEKTKYQAECLTLDYHGRFGLPVTVIRPTWTYGPGDRRTLRLFRAIANRRFLMIGRGDAIIHPAYVDHVVQGLRRAVKRRAAIGQTYIIGDAQAIAVQALVRFIAILLGTQIPDVRIPVWTARVAATVCEWTSRVFRFEPPLTRRRIGFFTRSAAFDISKARSELGYAPEVSLEESLRRTILWYKEHGYLPNP